MATIVINNDTWIANGGIFNASSGDEFIIDPGLIYSPTINGATDFSVNFEQSNPNGIVVTTGLDTQPTFNWADNVSTNLTTIQANASESTVFNVGSGSTVYDLQGSLLGTNDYTFGDYTTVVLNVYGGTETDTLTTGSNFEITYGSIIFGRETDLDGQGDVVNIGPDSFVNLNVQTGYGSDSITIGDGFTSNGHIISYGSLSGEPGTGDNIVIGNDVSIVGNIWMLGVGVGTDLNAFAGADDGTVNSLTIGDNYTSTAGGIVGPLGQLTLTVGDNWNFGGVIYTYYGDDSVVLGNSLDSPVIFLGQTGNDVLTIDRVNSSDYVQYDGGLQDGGVMDVLNFNNLTPTQLAAFETTLSSAGYIKGDDGLWHSSNPALWESFYIGNNLYSDWETVDLNLASGLGDGVVDGSELSEAMNPGYTDADGDEVDGADGLDDLIAGNGGNDTINAGLGNDMVDGGAGDDVISGSDGRDTLYGGAGNDVLSGGLDADILEGGLGADTIDGGAGDDDILAASGDSILGGSGDDYIRFDVNDTDGPGTITVDGGTDATSGAADDNTNGDAGDTLDATDLTNVQWVGTPVDDGTGSFSGAFSYENTDGETITVNFSEIENLVGFPSVSNGVVDGTAGADVIDVAYTGDPEGDMVDGADGLNDVVEAGAGDDEVYAGDGNDTVDAGTGDDYINGGDGDDSLLGGDGSDLIEGGTGDDNLSGGDGSDQIHGGTGADVLDGGNDDDDLIVGPGDTAYGGAGDDQFWAYASEGTGGTATVIGGETGEDLTDPTNGGDGDTLELWWDGAGYIADDQTVTMTGDEAGTATGSGTDIVFSEIEGINLGSGNDTVDLSADSAGMTVNTNDGDDSVIGGTGADDIAGGAGNDTILAGDGNDTIDGGTGNDSIDGWNGNDLVYGGDGDDTIWGQSGDDTIYGGDGSDFLHAGLGSDSLYGEAGNDTLEASGGSQILDGGIGDDLFNVDASDGTSTIIGGDDWDTLDLNQTNGFNVTFTGDGAGTFNSPTNTASGVFSEIEAITGSEGNDNINASADSLGVALSGDGGNDTLTGGTGSDTLVGGLGIDMVYGGVGDDSILAASGDTVYGGSGDDYFRIDGTNTDGPGTIGVYGDSDATSGAADDAANGDAGDTLDVTGLTNVQWVSLQVDDGTGSFSGAFTYENTDGETVTVNFAEIENLVGFPEANGIVSGTAGPDTMQVGYTDADGDGDQIDGLDGPNDNIASGAGNDTVFAGLGNDTVDGGTGNDSLSGEDGNDLLLGGDGLDTLKGGTGSDTLIGGLGSDMLYGDAGDDDFLLAAGDNALLPSGEVAYGDSGDDYFSFDGANPDGPGRIVIYGGVDATDGAGDDAANGNAGDTIDVTGLTNVQWAAEPATSDGQLYHWSSNPFNDGTGSYTGQFTYENVDGETITVTFSEIENLVGFPSPSNGVVDGTDGADVIDVAYTGDPEGDMVDGADGLNDVVEAGAGDDEVYAGAGNDTVDAGTGDDYINGGDGDDSLLGGDGSDLIEGGTGIDTLLGGDGSDQIHGGTGADVLDGGNDDDDLIVGAGDTAYGGAGDDQFWAYDGEGIGGTATVIGGETGEDLTDPTNGGDGDTLELWWDGAGYIADDQTVTMTGDEAGTVTGSDTDIVFSEIEGINLGSGNDTVDLSADSAGMTVNTNDGDDSVIGGTGDDTISGGSGDDTISGGTGDDVLTGGLGNDDFVYAAGDGADTITDFGDQTGTANDGDPTNNDHLDLSSFYNQTNYDAAVANGEIDPSVIKNPLQWMRADLDDDGVLNGSQGDAGFVPGDSLTLTGVTAADLTTETTNVICFARGSRIATAGGEVPVEHLSVGDRVITRDNGFQTIRWIGSARRKAVGRLAPIMIREGVLDNHRDLFVSPNHRMLIRSGVSELLTGESEVLVSAKLLVDGEGIVRVEGGEVEYFHILFDNHEIILSEGSWTESFHPGRFGMSTLCESARQEVLDLFPELGGNLEDAVTARLVLNAKEAALVAYGV